MNGTLVAFDSRLLDGATYRVECDGRPVDQFLCAESRLCTVTLLTQHPFAIVAVDPDIVPAPALPVEAGIALDDGTPRVWRRGKWGDIALIEPGSYVVRYDRALVALVLGPMED